MNNRNQNEKKRNRVLFDFESIVDVKLSYINHLKSIRTRPEGVDNMALRDSMENFKFRRMYVSTDIISSVFKDGKSPEDPNLLHPKNPIFTSMKLLVSESLNTGAGIIRPTVLCKDQFQERIIKNTIPSVRTLIGLRSQVKTINFSRIVLGDINHILDFKNPVTVDFMILNFRENMSEEDREIIGKVAFLYGDVNEFTIVKAYPEIEDPVG